MATALLSWVLNRIRIAQYRHRQGKAVGVHKSVKPHRHTTALLTPFAQPHHVSSPSASLQAGTRLSMPTQVGGLHNSANTFKPYDPSKVTGDTTPNLPMPPVDSGGGCGALGMIIMIIVAVVVTVLSVGTLGPVAAAMLGSVASQVVGMAIGAVDSFSWKAVALAAITAGVTDGLPVGDMLGTTAGTVSNTIVRAAVGNALTQGIAVATGLQEHFNWRGVAMAGVSAGVSYGVSDLLTSSAMVEVAGPTQDGSPLMARSSESVFGNNDLGNLARSGLSSFAGGVGSAAVSGHSVNLRNIARDSFNNVMGNYLGGQVITSIEENRLAQAKEEQSRVQAQRQQNMRAAMAAEDEGWAEQNRLYDQKNPQSSLTAAQRQAQAQGLGPLSPEAAAAALLRQGGAPLTFAESVAMRKAAGQGSYTLTAANPMEPVAGPADPLQGNPNAAAAADSADSNTITAPRRSQASQLTVGTTDSGRNEYMIDIAKRQYGDQWREGLALMTMANGLERNKWASLMVQPDQSLVAPPLDWFNDKQLGQYRAMGNALISDNDRGLTAKASLERQVAQAKADLAKATEEARVANDTSNAAAESRRLGNYPGETLVAQAGGGMPRGVAIAPATEQSGWGKAWDLVTGVVAVGVAPINQLYDGAAELSNKTGLSNKVFGSNLRTDTADSVLGFAAQRLEGNSYVPAVASIGYGAGKAVVLGVAELPLQVADVVTAGYNVATGSNLPVNNSMLGQMAAKGAGTVDLLKQVAENTISVIPVVAVGKGAFETTTAIMNGNYEDIGAGLVGTVGGFAYGAGMKGGFKDMTDLGSLPRYANNIKTAAGAVSDTLGGISFEGSAGGGSASMRPQIGAVGDVGNMRPGSAAGAGADATAALREPAFSAASEGSAASTAADLQAGRRQVAAKVYEEAGFSPERAAGHLDGIDFNHPVTLETLPQGKVFEQQMLGGNKGNYFTEVGTAPETVGINPAGRVPGAFTPTEPIQALRSTAAPIVDTWTTPGQPYQTMGGGTQLFVPNKALMVPVGPGGMRNVVGEFRPIPESYMKPGAVVDMQAAPPGSGANAAGFPRNGPWFWRQMVETKPEYFDAANTARIRAGRSPVVNDSWIQSFPEHQGFLGDKLVHHHIEQGPLATPLPETIHQKWYKPLHPNQ
jgi:hypothetical protein